MDTAGSRAAGSERGHGACGRIAQRARRAAGERSGWLACHLGAGPWAYTYSLALWHHLHAICTARQPGCISPKEPSAPPAPPDRFRGHPKPAGAAPAGRTSCRRAQPARQRSPHTAGVRKVRSSPTLSGGRLAPSPPLKQTGTCTDRVPGRWGKLQAARQPTLTACPPPCRPPPCAWQPSIGAAAGFYLALSSASFVRPWGRRGPPSWRTAAPCRASCTAALRRVRAPVPARHWPALQRRRGGSSLGAAPFGCRGAVNE